MNWLMKRPISRALISSDGQYRKVLTRIWGDAPPVTFIMLNPSTADATKDDPTIRRCKGFTAAWGFAGIHVVNLYDFRATKPEDLKWAETPCSPDNDNFIIDYCHRTWMANGLVVAAWGAHGSWGNRDEDVIKMLCRESIPLHNIGLTKHGQPKHPLYVRADTKPVSWYA